MVYGGRYIYRCEKFKIHKKFVLFLIPEPADLTLTVHYTRWTR